MTAPPALVPKERAPTFKLADSDGTREDVPRTKNVPLDGKETAPVPDQFVVRLKLVFVPLHVRSWADAGDMWTIAKPPHTTAKAVRISRLNPFRRSFPAMIKPPRRKAPKLPWITPHPLIANGLTQIATNRQRSGT